MVLPDVPPLKMYHHRRRHRCQPYITAWLCSVVHCLSIREAEMEQIAARDNGRTQHTSRNDRFLYQVRQEGEGEGGGRKVRSPERPQHDLPLDRLRGQRRGNRDPHRNRLKPGAEGGRLADQHHREPHQLRKLDVVRMSGNAVEPGKTDLFVRVKI